MRNVNDDGPGDVGAFMLSMPLELFLQGEGNLTDIISREVVCSEYTFY